MSNVSGIRNAFANARLPDSPGGEKVDAKELREAVAAAREDKQVDAAEKLALAQEWRSASAEVGATPMAEIEARSLFQSLGVNPAAVPVVPPGATFTSLSELVPGTYQIPVEAYVPNVTSGRRHENLKAHAVALVTKGDDGTLTISLDNLPNLRQEGGAKRFTVGADGSFTGTIGDLPHLPHHPHPNTYLRIELGYGSRSSGTTGELKGELQVRDGKLHLETSYQWKAVNWSVYSGAHQVTSSPYRFRGAVG